MNHSVQTSDIVLAAALKVLGFKLDRITKTGNRGEFCFSEIPDAVMAQFDLGQMLVEPVAFNTAIKSLTTATRRLI